MYLSSVRVRLLATTMITTAAFVLAAPGGAAIAETTASATTPSTSSTVEEIIVTGSLIKQRIDAETPAPVTTLTAKRLTEEGITTVADAVRSISADNSGTVPTAFSNGFASGASGVSLRGLTVNSTLVLIDGLRTSNYPLADDGVRGFVDLNTIPFSAVQQVEVLKDGASSIYGADAIGGVVNIIMKPTFQGLEGDIEQGISQHGGGYEQRYQATVGHGDLATDKYNAYLTFEFQQDASIRVGERGFPFNTADLSSIGGFNNTGGQPGQNSGSVYGSVAPVAPDGTIGLTQPLRACGAPTIQATDGAGNVYCAQNFKTYLDDQPAETRYGVLGHFTAQITPDMQAFFTGSYFVNRTFVDGAPPQIQSPQPVNNNGITLPALLANGQLNPNNPFAAQGEAATINYAFGDIPAYSILFNHVYRFTAGVKGTLAGWDYTASLNVNHSALVYTQAGYLLESVLANDIATGAYSFINPASNSSAVRKALSPTEESTSTSDLDSLDLSATRKIYQLPGGPLAIAIGTQVRYEAVDDPNANIGGLYEGLNAYDAHGKRTVASVFGEIDAPILKQVDVTLAGRYDHYSDFGGNFSPKFGVKFTPIKQIILRGTYSEGFRAPAFAENGNSSVVGYVGYAANSSPAFVAAHGGDAYATQGYALGEYAVGNPSIKPETSRSYTLGGVFEPTSFFNISVDYYHITKSNVIGPGAQGPVLAAYYAGQPLPPGSSVTPDVPDPLFPAAQARPLVVQTPYVNSNAIETQGLDIDARLHFTLHSPLGLPQSLHVSSDLNWTDIFDYNYTFGAGAASAQTFNYAGTMSPYNLSSGAGTPKYRATWSTSFTYGPVTVTGTANYVSGYKENAADLGDPTGCVPVDFYGAPTPITPGCKVSHFVDFDLTGSYQINDRIQIYFNVLNLFDAGPPLDPSSYAGAAVNYNPTYSQAGIIGRFFKVGFHVNY